MEEFDNKPVSENENKTAPSGIPQVLEDFLDADTVEEKRRREARK